MGTCPSPAWPYLPSGGGPRDSLCPPAWPSGEQQARICSSGGASQPERTGSPAGWAALEKGSQVDSGRPIGAQ